jgi:ABC-type antimicrobial peptide transport system permease subunit
MPKVEKDAYKEFKRAYRAGYILDMFAYQADIDSYTIDPFIDLLSKVGLFVFAVFTIGILWTIISIEIVDSKKEIGIFRSIGLSGSKVSFIFIFQTAMISIVAWGLSLIASNFILNIFNQNIMDDLGIIRLSMYMMTYRSPIFLIIFLILMTGAAIFIPLYKIMSQKIIDVISERDAL